MKKTVKIISVVCALVMLLGILPIVSVSATDDAATLVVTPSKETVKAGREFTVTVSLANNPGIWSLKFDLTYDAEAFTYLAPDPADEEAVNAEAPADVLNNLCLIGADVAGQISYNRGYSNLFANTTKNGALAVFKFIAKEDADLTDYTFTATVDSQQTVAIDTTNPDSNETKTYLVPVSGASATVTLIPNVAESTIDSAQVKLGTDISVKYFVTLDEDHAGAQMKFTFNEEETIVDGVATGYADEYEYTFTGVAPQCMGDNLKAELIVDGAVVATKDNYSVLANCQNLLAKSAAELDLTDAQYAAMETLIADLLVYGAKAQLYNNYKTTALVDANVEGATALGAIDAANDVKYTEGSSSETVAFTAAGVFFDYANSLYYKFTAPDMTESNFKIVFVTYDENYDVVDSVTYTLADCELIDEATATYKFSTDDISVLDYGTIYSVELYVKSGRNWGDPVQFLDYSVNSYAYAKQDTANAKMADLAKALYNYGVSAVAFLNA